MYTLFEKNRKFSMARILKQSMLSWPLGLLEDYAR
jgi:hypothetical protein